jgi:hypothetical protein
MSLNVGTSYTDMELVDPNELVLHPNFNGPQRWKEYTGAEVGKAPALPKWVFKCMEKGEHMLTFIPETVRITKEGGKELEVRINSLEAVDLLFKNGINGRKIGFSRDSWEAAIREIRPSEKGHWALISKREIGRCLNYRQQLELANEMGADASELIDTVISLFMEYLRTGERHFIMDPPQCGLRTWTRVKEQTNGLRINLGFAPSGLFVGYCDEDSAYDYLAIVPEKKFFGN